MMFHVGYNDLVSGFYILSSPGLRNKIDTFCCSTCENDLFPAFRVDKFLCSISCGFKGGSSFLGQSVYAPVNVCIVIAVVVYQGINYCLRLLCCCSIVKIHKWLSFHLAVECRKM